MWQCVHIQISSDYHISNQAQFNWFLCPKHETLSLYWDCLTVRRPQSGSAQTLKKHYFLCKCAFKFYFFFYVFLLIGCLYELASQWDGLDLLNMNIQYFLSDFEANTSIINNVHIHLHLHILWSNTFPISNSNS